MRRWKLRLGFLLALAALYWWMTPRPIGEIAEIDATVPKDLDSWIAREVSLYDRRYGLVPGTEQRIRWQAPGERTEFSIVYLHGFSASRQEIAPTTEIVADALGANLFETRLHGHGYLTERMVDVSAERWIQDVIEALTVGAAIGDRLIVISTSTGGTLTMAAAGTPQMEKVESLVMISPNFAPADLNARWTTRPFGRLITKALAGDTRTWQAHNERQEKYWTTSYPTDAAIEVMRLVDYVQEQLPIKIDQELLVLVSPDDSVVSPEATRRTFELIEAPRKRLVEYDRAEDPSGHVLAGDILSPGTTAEVAGLIVEFLNGR